METLKSVMVQNIQNLSNSDLNDDEYLKDDIIYCKKCNTPRQTKQLFLGIKKTVRCLCKCQTEECKHEEEKQQEIERQLRIEKLRQASLLGERYKNTTFDNTITGNNKEFDIAFERCKSYCDNCKEVLKNGYGIYIYGDKGIGKTHITACMANELTKNYKQVLFTNFTEISKLIRQTFKGNGDEAQVINKICNIDFLFIDDLGTERVTSNGEDLWLQEKIFDVINKRYNNMKPTIFTSNYNMQQLIEDRGIMDKTVDRILEMSTVILNISGKSYRQKKREKNNIPF